MKTIKNFELKVKRVQVGEGGVPYGGTIRQPADVAEIARRLIGDDAQERFIVFLLDVKNRILGFHEAGRGGIDSCSVDPRVVFRTAVVLGAGAILCAHNHPSSDPTPSSDDFRLTRRLKECGDLLGIQLLDHVVVTDTVVTSLRERRLL